MYLKRKFWPSQWVLFFGLLATGPVNGQGTCPPNIGFESGNFTHWETYIGKIQIDGKISLTQSAPRSSRHRMYANSNRGEIDLYGKFPVNCPNGSGYSIRLGNDSSDAEAESVRYTFVIPADKNDYSLIYNYAVVMQDPGHLDYQQPRFASRIFNVTDNKYVDCAGFEFVASSDLPDFLPSAYGEEVYYKTWSPITINLFGYAGKTLRLEFTTNDCVARQHFGYAYVDVNENCSTPLSGNVICVNRDMVTLTAPYGFKEYNWYNADFSQRLGTENILKIFPAIPGTKYAVQIIPYAGLGCLDTLRTTIRLSGEPFHLQVVDSVVGCVLPGIDLTAKFITAGSSAGIFFSYFSDANLVRSVPVPKEAPKGTYYIKAENSTGCTDVKPVKAMAIPVGLTITAPSMICLPDNADITTNAITAGTEPGLTFSYWKDSVTTIRVASPKSISEKGVYFIKATNAAGCYAIKPITVTIGLKPDFTIVDPPAVMYPASVDLNESIRSAAGNTFSFWKDLLTTQRIIDPKAIDTSGVYYIKGSNVSGCTVIAPVKVIINPPINAPNAFSPNNDGIHDVWSIPSLQLYPGCQVEVFDRYGKSVFRSTGYPKEWNGKNLSGKSLPQGTYYYVIKLSAAIPPIGGSVTVLH